MAKRGRKSPIQQHVEQLQALDTQFEKFEKKLRKAIRANPDLKPLEAELDRTLTCVTGPAYGFRKGPRGRR